MTAREQELEERVRLALRENARTIDEFEAQLGRFPRENSAWLGALLVMMAFVGGGLAWACVERLVLR